MHSDTSHITDGPIVRPASPAAFPPGGGAYEVIPCDDIADLAGLIMCGNDNKFDRFDNKIDRLVYFFLSGIVLEGGFDFYMKERAPKENRIIL